ncbi:amino acid ABC transporter ATP-binding protein [Clostridium sporogenes]|uniref:Amino acid ABC transporter ATP-binding protein n=1 Tax=Clostridium sporogenes TaxID=1509 RepID=A0A7X5PD47_CLOSG|nr:amino acid ABC transporter ATP-binding protein [Clostridium sporogenes]AJD32242.1 putative amino-acid import ATP-binding protein YxeO [Clostridium botulinum Prevot_594]NFQ18483.1 amino acid ABC transporter ATP-binding protein [Clostridium sporogenes]NFQ22114.1 amino acid ABC transporter ATP-binding protein [Clostridium sporogenes]NFQ29118.1 amino acid ABC transporter ATP-binding protein [Clostridium sporogenes]NFR62639.1 amino acid ABC transporter ATP-binding protein [Clostridium sporogenes
MIKIEHLKMQFEQVVILKDISIEIGDGEVVAIIGPSGTGKSTFLRCLNFLVKPTEGKITIDGFTVDAKTASKKDIHELWQKTAMVFQNYNLLKNKTAIQNIMEPMITVQKKTKKEAEEIAIDLIKKVGLLEKRDAYPREMSGGQQQRIGIARAMAVNTNVILFDEPTSSLDPELVGEVLTVIKQLAEEHNKTMLIVTHEMKFAKEVADKMIFLEDGYIAGMGTPKEIFGNCTNERIRKFVNTVTANGLEDK